jgi:hypothetical protein
VGIRFLRAFGSADRKRSDLSMCGSPRSRAGAAIICSCALISSASGRFLSAVLQ